MTTLVTAHAPCHLPDSGVYTMVYTQCVWSERTPVSFNKYYIVNFKVL